MGISAAVRPLLPPVGLSPLLSPSSIIFGRKPLLETLSSVSYGIESRHGREWMRGREEMKNSEIEVIASRGLHREEEIKN
ncbi:hypothetical protein ACLOJK_003950 [Asimina triloba]